MISIFGIIMTFWRGFFPFLSYFSSLLVAFSIFILEMKFFGAKKKEITLNHQNLSKLLK